MAPLTRMRAGARETAPTALNAGGITHNEQPRGLIIAEGTAVSQQGQGYPKILPGSTHRSKWRVPEDRHRGRSLPRRTESFFRLLITGATPPPPSVARQRTTRCPVCHPPKLPKLYEPRSASAHRDTGSSTVFLEKLPRSSESFLYKPSRNAIQAGLRRSGTCRHPTALD